MDMNNVLSISASGIAGAMQRLQSSAHAVAAMGAGDSPAGPDQASVLGELMVARIANNVIASNAALIRRWDEALGNLLDVTA